MTTIAAASDNAGWSYVGSVGTGCNTKEAEYLRKNPRYPENEDTRHSSQEKKLIFAQPTLIAEIEFRG